MATPNNHEDGLLVQIASYNTNLQGVLGLPQDLVDWLAPTLHVSSFLTKQRRAPDIVAVGFQELLPLHLGLLGLSASVVEDRNTLILSQIEQHAPNGERYSLIAKVVNVGVALLIYGLDDGVAKSVYDVQTTWTGSGPCYMGNKGAVGVRFCVRRSEQEVGETFTFVCAHLTSDQHKLKNRVADYKHIVETLVFPPASKASNTPTTLYSTSHLFFFGDLNFRLDIPPSNPLCKIQKMAAFAHALDDGYVREDLKEHDQLLVQMRKGTAFIGLREGEFWRFKCSYKCKLGEVDKYSPKRTPAWTDRVLYATYLDSPDSPSKSQIKNVLYTSIPSYTTSDHKPIVCLLLLPPSQNSIPISSTPQTIQLPERYRPTVNKNANVKRYVGRSLDRVTGAIWWMLVFLGAGSGIFGFCNFMFSIGAWTWWNFANSQQR